MKIAHVVCVYPPYKGGIGNVARDFAELACKAGHDVSVYYPASGLISDFESKANLNILPLRPLFKYGNGAFLPQLFFRLKDYDIVHLHYPFFGAAEIVFLTKLFFPKSFRLYIHYHMDTRELGLIPSILSIFSKIIMKSLFKKADLITCASFDYVSSGSLKDVYAKYQSKFFLLPFGVNTDKFFPLAKKNRKPEIQLLFVGGLDKAHAFKGLDVLIEALKKIKNEKIQLKIVGEGELKKDFCNLAKTKGVDKSIFFCGGIDNSELAKLYRESDIFILPSINGHEAFGIVLLEAMASGIPVIASGLPGVREVFTSGEEGFFVKPGSTDDLLEKINKLASDPLLRQKMGERGRRLVEKKYGFNILKKRLEKIYENMPD